MFCQCLAVIVTLLEYSLTLRTGRGLGELNNFNLNNYWSPVGLKFVLLEDLGTGYCHSHGLGWLGETVPPHHILGEPGELGEEGEESNGTTTINIYWSRLVVRPACVDTLIITTEGKGETDHRTTTSKYPPPRVL